MQTSPPERATNMAGRENYRSAVSDFRTGEPHYPRPEDSHKGERFSREFRDDMNSGSWQEFFSPTADLIEISPARRDEITFATAAAPSSSARGAFSFGESNFAVSKQVYVSLMHCEKLHLCSVNTPDYE